MRYTDKLRARIRATGSALCVGLDPRPDGGNTAALGRWLLRVAEETAPFAAAYKPNIAYFEAMGPPGLELLQGLLRDMPEDIPVILDAKRGDIGETQKYYAHACFERLGADAVTLNPFMGYDTLEPFLDAPGKGVYLLAVTSNPGAADIELRMLADGRPVYRLVADMVRRAQAERRAADAGMVVGLTNTSGALLEELPDAPLLIPGLGAQGGDIQALAGGRLTAPFVVNVSRGILYREPELSFADKARKYAGEIRRILTNPPSTP
ncbi:MAG: orotidine-5'-phosphate decarboxylase [Akkermansia sp.]|nr:orotidine-5'-phosphate decarboxylase [Akkermansia sp.]